MPTQVELINVSASGALNFGDYTLARKSKKEDFSFKGNVYKVKTFNEITRLEKNERLIYESIPGTTVSDFADSPNGVSFNVTGPLDDANLVLGLEESTTYTIKINGAAHGNVKTGISGKLDLEIDLSSGQVAVEVSKA